MFSIIGPGTGYQELFLLYPMSVQENIRIVPEIGHFTRNFHESLYAHSSNKRGHSSAILMTEMRARDFDSTA